jgi:hypothetical protein
VSTERSLRSTLETLRNEAVANPVASGKARKPAPFVRKPVLQELEARLLMSADLNPAAQESLLATPALQGAEFRALTEGSAPTVVTSAQVAPLHRTNELVFVDTATPEYDQLVAAMREAALTEGRNLEFVLIDAERDGIRRITDTLAQKSDLDAIHIISHAADGAVQLGSTQLDFESLLKRAGAIKKWGDALTENGDILIYGCDLAASQEGKSLVDALSRLTGADVAASEDLTGAASKGGDGTEFRAGTVEAQVAVGAAAQSSWSHALAVAVDGTDSNGTTTGSSLNISHTTSGSERLMLVTVSMTKEAAGAFSASSVTYNGDALSLVGSGVTSDGKGRVEIWSMVAPDLGTNNVVVNLSGSPDGTAVGVMTFTGVDQADPLRSQGATDFVSATADSGTALVNVTSAVGDLVFAGVVIEGSDKTMAPVGTLTEHWELFVGSATNGAGGTKTPAGASESMSWTFSGDKSSAALSPGRAPARRRFRHRLQRRRRDATVGEVGEGTFRNVTVRRTDVDDGSATDTWVQTRPRTRRASTSPASATATGSSPKTIGTAGRHVGGLHHQRPGRQTPATMTGGAPDLGARYAVAPRTTRRR